MKYLHVIQLAIGLVASLALIVSSMLDFEYRATLSIGYIAIGSTLLAFTMVHSFILKSRGAMLHKVALYLPVYIASVYVLMPAWVSFTKDWAPFAPQDVFWSKVQTLLLIALLLTVALFSILAKPRSTA